MEVVHKVEYNETREALEDDKEVNFHLLKVKQRALGLILYLHLRFEVFTLLLLIKRVLMHILLEGLLHKIKGHRSRRFLSDSFRGLFSRGRYLLH